MAVLVALLLVALFGVAAFTLDGGGMYDLRRRASTAAESAASAAAIKLLYPPEGQSAGTSRAEAIGAGLALAAANGFPNDGATSSVVINIPPASGPFAGKDGFVEVLVHGYRARTFSSIFGAGRLEVVGRAVAAGGNVPTKGSILLLDPKRKQAAKIDNAYVELSGDLIVNSKDKKALSVRKKGQLKADNVVVSGGVERTKKQDALLEGDLSTGVAPTPDPLAGLPRPDTSATTLKADNFRTQSGGRDYYALKPGVYDALKFDEDDVVTMEPGTYVVVKDGVEFKKSASLEARGVTIYNASNKDMNFSTSGAVTITPPGTGAYAGISLVNDAVFKRKISFKADAQLDVYGMIYAPTGEVRFQKIDTSVGGFPDEEEDPDAPPADVPADNFDGTGVAAGSIGAQIIAGRLKVDQHSRLIVRGTGIAAERPFFGLVE